MVGRHEVLRTVFPAADGEPYQQVLGLDELGWELPVTEVAEADLPRRGGDRGGGRAIRPGRRRCRCGPRCCAVAPDVHVLVLVSHHIASDGWSTGMLGAGSVGGVCGAPGGRAPGWAPLPVQYADYALWQRELFGDEDDPGRLLAGQVACWREPWPGRRRSWRCRWTGRVRRWPVTAGMSCRWRYPPGLQAGLAVLAREQGVTLFMVVHAALAALLSRLGAGDDIPVGHGGSRAGPTR